jgi:hypothetical protein
LFYRQIPLPHFKQTQLDRSDPTAKPRTSWIRALPQAHNITICYGLVRKGHSCESTRRRIEDEQMHDGVLHRCANAALTGTDGAAWPATPKPDKFLTTTVAGAPGFKAKIRI